MKYTKKERMNIGRQIYEDQINKYEAAGKYGISAQTAREYMRMYRNTNHLPPKTSKPRDYGLAKAKVIPERPNSMNTRKCPRKISSAP